ncbi:hypothetical protein OS493_000693 [Desmophyllum pertusum]|uniref:Uncharacterized protein n=1 Tax=Desmophyllum pertusum TaxID=174260 RepID=A0A9X0DDL6_9CNID|nr:hypothetical protein OS493_000693 [Desmophyllum pertusum]
MDDEEVKTATEGWKPGKRAIKKMIEWCQDQWRRKYPAYPTESCSFSANEPCTMPWYVDMPVCFNCGVPCPECRTELGLDIPMEMSTAHALLDFKKIHADSDDNNEQPAESSEAQATSTMTLRSSRKK